MVKITEGWITVQDGTKLYTKSWEVSQSRIFITQMSVTYQTARYLLLLSVSSYISSMHCF